MSRPRHQLEGESVVRVRLIGKVVYLSAAPQRRRINCTFLTAFYRPSSFSRLLFTCSIYCKCSGTIQQAPRTSSSPNIFYTRYTVSQKAIPFYFRLR